ncbi:NAD(P)H-hydrate epimerase [Tabrizicola thermarum]|uniref:NAD(P)H-hydrate epimerase n=1 Tax=Tabrizicola thermarum TaxID=2670345 RepID=UPI000FFCB649|nr:NAD(P)H-hydrate epimerase [Tabrizicola thermarum]
MTELLTAAQMRAIEQAAIASGEVTGLELMERAGKGVVEAIFEEWPELKATSHRAVVLCGPGNNGGDGFVVARLLKDWGWEVEVFLHGDPERLPPDARVNYERWLGLGEVGDLTRVPDGFFRNRAIVVDALFGIGLAREVQEDLVRPLRDAWLDEDEPDGPRLVAIDIPSGVSSDTGGLLADIPPMHLTVTFHCPKLGHFLGLGPRICGKLRVVDLGISEILQRRDVMETGFLRRVRLNAPRPEFRKRPEEHKYAHGHALILSGPSGRGGAARLAARGALRIGAGVVTVGCPPDAIPENAARLDAVMLRGVADGLALEEALADRRINALCVGPGLGLDARGRELVEVALGMPVPGLTRDLTPGGGEGGKGGPGSGPGRGLVLDADALTILSQTPDLFSALHGDCVLTPHAGEFARLFPDIAEKLAAPATRGPAYSKVDATREAAMRAGCVVLYKGPDTVIADPTGRCAINSAHYDRAAPWLATAGSGDVLAGFITGLLARGFSPFDAAATSAWLHVECALSFGPGLIAEDLPEELPKVFRALGL